jgi:hypothetical protein
MKFLENKTEILQHALKYSKLPSCLNIQNEFLGVFFLPVFIQANVGLLKADYFNQVHNYQFLHMLFLLIFLCL